MQISLSIIENQAFYDGLLRFLEPLLELCIENSSDWSLLSRVESSPTCWLPLDICSDISLLAPLTKVNLGDYFLTLLWSSGEDFPILILYDKGIKICYLNVFEATEKKKKKHMNFECKCTWSPILILCFTAKWKISIKKAFALFGRDSSDNYHIHF